MPWGGKGYDKAPKEPPPESAKAPTSNGKTLDPDILPERVKLPAALQKLVDDADKNESFYGELIDG